MLFYGGQALFYQSFFITDNIISSTSVISPPYVSIPVSSSSGVSNEMNRDRGDNSNPNHKNSNDSNDGGDNGDGGDNDNE